MVVVSLERLSSIQHTAQQVGSLVSLLRLQASKRAVQCAPQHQLRHTLHICLIGSAHNSGQVTSWPSSPACLLAWADQHRLWFVVIVIYYPSCVLLVSAHIVCGNFQPIQARTTRALWACRSERNHIATTITRREKHTAHSDRLWPSLVVRSGRRQFTWLTPRRCARILRRLVVRSQRDE